MSGNRPGTLLLDIRDIRQFFRVSLVERIAYASFPIESLVPVYKVDRCTVRWIVVFISVGVGVCLLAYVSNPRKNRFFKNNSDGVYLQCSATLYTAL